MMTLLVILAVLAAAMCIPVGVRAVYDETARVYLTVLGLPIRLYPTKNKKKTEKPSKKEKKPKKKFQLPPYPQLQEYLRLLLEILGRLRKKLVVRHMTLHAFFGGSDQADAALNYGRAWAAIGVVTPLLEQCFTIRKRDVGAYLEEGQSTVRLVARLHTTITVGRLLHLLLLALWRFYKIYKTNQPEKAV